MLYWAHLLSIERPKETTVLILITDLISNFGIASMLNHIIDFVTKFRFMVWFKTWKLFQSLISNVLSNLIHFLERGLLSPMIWEQNQSNCWNCLKTTLKEKLWLPLVGCANFPLAIFHFFNPELTKMDENKKLSRWKK